MHPLISLLSIAVAWMEALHTTNEELEEENAQLRALIATAAESMPGSRLVIPDSARTTLPRDGRLLVYRDNAERATVVRFTQVYFGG